MSRVSRTTLDKRQLLTLIGGAVLTSKADAQGITNGRRPSGAAVVDALSVRSEDGSAASPTSGTDQYPIPSPPISKGACGCEAFVPPTDAALIAQADGSFPAFLQTACLVSYVDPSAATTAASQTNAVPTVYNTSVNEAEPSSPVVAPSATRSPSPPARGSASPTRRETTLKPSAAAAKGALAARASSQPIYVPDDAYDLEVDAQEQREAMPLMSDEEELNATANTSGPNEPPSEEAIALREAQKQQREKSIADHKAREDAKNIRATAPLENEVPATLVSEVWTAEADGTVSIRNASNGRHSKGQLRIPAFGRISTSTAAGGGNCYVTAMVQVRNYVFAGYVDGFVRAFDVVTKELLFEKRKHAAAVNAIVQWKDNIVFSASDDFRIMMWKVGTEKTADEELRTKRAKRNNESLSGFSATEVPPPSTPSPTYSPTYSTPQSVHTTTTGTIKPPTSAQGADVFELPSFLHQLAGHTSRIHALHVEGDYLFSGGGDGVVKCWDIRTRTELVQKGRYPILAHPNGGVRDITCCQDVLITAGKGGVSLYDVETCELMHRFTGFPEVNRILVDPSSLVLWACCSTSGTVTLIDLYTFREIGTLADFSAATIKTIATVSTSPSSRLFLGIEGEGLSVAYCEAGTTGMGKNYIPLNAATERKYKTLDALREEIFANEENLASYRRLLWSIRDTDQYHKHAASSILAHGKEFQQKKQYLERCLVYVIKHRHKSRQHTIAARLERGCDQRLRFTALLKWFLYRRAARDARFKEFVTTSLANEHERQLIGRQLSNVVTFMATAQRLRSRKLIVPTLERYHIQRQIISFFTKWRRWVQEKHAAIKRSKVVGYLGDRNRKTAETHTYRKLLSYSSVGEVRNLNIRSCIVLHNTIAKTLLRQYFGNWVKRRQQIRRDLQRKAMSALVANHYEVPIRRRYFNLLWDYANQHKKAKATSQLNAQNERIDFMNRMIDQEGPGQGTREDKDTEASLDDEILKIEREIAEVEAANEVLKQNITVLSKHEDALMAECGGISGSEKAIPKRRREAGEAESAAVTNTSKNTSEDATPYDRCEAAMRTIRTGGFNLKVARAEVTKRNGMAPTGAAARKPTLVFPRGRAPSMASNSSYLEGPAVGFNKAVEAIFASIKPLSTQKEDLAMDDQWELDAGASISRESAKDHSAAEELVPRLAASALSIGLTSTTLSKSAVKKVVGPIQEAVVAWDYIRNRHSAPQSADGAAAHSAEVFARNINVIQTIFAHYVTNEAEAPDSGHNSPRRTPTPSRNSTPRRPNSVSVNRNSISVNRGGSAAPTSTPATPLRAPSATASKGVPKTVATPNSTKARSPSVNRPSTSDAPRVPTKAPTTAPSKVSASPNPVRSGSKGKAPSTPRAASASVSRSAATSAAKRNPSPTPQPAGKAPSTPRTGTSTKSVPRSASLSKVPTTPRAGSTSSVPAPAPKRSSTPSASPSPNKVLPNRSKTPIGTTAARPATAKAPSATSSATASRKPLSTPIA